jgi:hypothetical protein
MTLFRLVFDDAVIPNITLLLNYASGYGMLDYRAGNTEDTIALCLLGVSYSENLNLLRDLEFFVEKVQRWQKNPSFPRVYLERDWSDSGTEYYRTPLEDLKIVFPESFYHDFRGRKPELDLVFRHPEYWESEEISLQLGMGTTSPITVNNVTGNQGAKGNYKNYTYYDYNLYTADFQSALPYPLKISLTSQDTDDIEKVWLCLTHSQSTAPDHVLSAESGTGGTTLPATPDYNLYQGGRYKQYNVATSWNTLGSWSIDPQMSEYESLTVWARWLNPSEDVLFGVQLSQGLFPLTDWRQFFALNTEWNTVGLLRGEILSNLLDYAPFQLNLLGWAKDVTTADIDYLELWPTLDTVELFSASGRPLANGEKLVLDGSTRLAWVENASGNILDHWVIKGSSNLCWVPGRTAKIIYKSYGFGHVDKTVQMQIKARARYRA